MSVITIVNSRVNYQCTMFVCVWHLQVSVLFLALHFGPVILLLLQFLGHLQVLLHQFALIDVGRQVALNCGRRNPPAAHQKKNTGEQSATKFRIFEWILIFSSLINRTVDSEKKINGRDTDAPAASNKNRALLVTEKWLFAAEVPFQGCEMAHRRP